MIHSGLKTTDRSKIVSLFQGEIKPTKSEPRPQFLIGTTQLINTGITLTASTKVIIWEAEWMGFHEQQLKARSNRLGQQALYTESIALVNKSSLVDMAIHDRHNARQQLINLLAYPVAKANPAKTHADEHSYMPDPEIEEEESESEEEE